MAELLITSSLDAVEEGQVFIHELPRHVTIWQYFTLSDAHVDDFMHDAGEAIRAFPPIAIRGTEEDRFGPNNDVPVRRLEKIGHGATVVALHTVLGGLIDRYDGEIRSPEWAYENYNPHITYVGGRALNEGEEATLQTVELVQASSNPKYKLMKKIWDLEEA